MTIKFSSPSGDGLVLKNEKNKCKNLKIFVPAWGWVGSIFSPCKNQLVYVFSSPLGDGLVHKKNQKDGNSAAYFRPRVGMGWFTGFNPERFQKIAFFRPRLGVGWFASKIPLI